MVSEARLQNVARVDRRESKLVVVKRTFGFDLDVVRHNEAVLKVPGIQQRVILVVVVAAPLVIVVVIECSQPLKLLVIPRGALSLALHVDL
jgi:mRNA-degrading endonuclease HigB of HigAB toxin-antitoxin module